MAAMKSLGKIGMAILLAGLLAGNAWADRRYHHHHPHSSVRLGFYFGDPWLYPPFYSYPPFGPRVYMPGPVIVSPPPIYIEQAPVVVPAPAPVATPEPGYWYYCDEAKGYYPYIRECPGGWHKVLPQPRQ